MSTENKKFSNMLGKIDSVQYLKTISKTQEKVNKKKKKNLYKFTECNGIKMDNTIGYI